MQSGHNFAHVMTTQLSWHVHNYDLAGLILSLFFFHDLDYKYFVKWVTGSDTICLDQYWHTGHKGHRLAPTKQ